MHRIWICSVVALTGILATTSQATAQQPFENVQKSPTVSPYFNLQVNQRGGLPAYFTQVRPQIDQQQQNQNTQRQISNLSAQSRLPTAGLTTPARGISSEIRGTGHPTGFMTTGNFYPRSQISTSDPITRRLITGDYNQ